jgi:hypothetical protein
MCKHSVLSYNILKNNISEINYFGNFDDAHDFDINIKESLDLEKN